MVPWPTAHWAVGTGRWSQTAKIRLGPLYAYQARGLPHELSQSAKWIKSVKPKISSNHFLKIE